MSSAPLYQVPLPNVLPPPEPAPNREQEELILAHMEEVKQIARSIVRRLPASVQLDDLIQAGALGLMDAARRFGRNQSLPFRQYARIRITGAIFDSLRELDWASRYFRTRQQKLDQANRALEARLGRQPDSDELAEFMGMDLNTFFEFAQAVQNRLEVEFEPQEDSGKPSIQESAADDPEQRPDSLCHQNESRKKLQRVVAQLPGDESRVLILYYYKDWTMARIAASIGKTESRVSQIHSRALSRLRDRLGPRGSRMLSRVL